MLNYETNTQFFQFQVCALILVCLIAGMLSTSVHADPPAGNWDLIWSDEFDSGSTPEFPNSSNWGYEDGYKRNEEWQYYTNDIQNAYCQDGFLHIEAHKHSAGTYPTGNYDGQDGSISSASLKSKDKIEHQYGWLEMRGRIDTQLGSWPAFWTLGSTGEWPDNGECDIMEYYRGRLKFNVAWWKTGDTRWSPRWDSETVYLSSLPSGWTDEFHVWAMEWTPEYVKLYMDGVLYNTWDASRDNNGDGDTSTEGFQQPHYIILNQAIGGTAGGDASGVVYPTNYELDWVRWYSVADTTPPTPNPATFAEAPAADSNTAISMTATTGSDASGPVEYFFDETSGNPGGTDSNWTPNPVYTDIGLTLGTQYTYTVQMRDAVGNIGTVSAPASATTTEVIWTQIIYDDFEDGFGNWVDGGTDCSLYIDGTYAHQGSNAIDLQDDSSTSFASTNDLALSAYDKVKVDFWFKSIDFTGSENFWLQISTDGGENYTTVMTWVVGTDFSNDQFYHESVIIAGYTLTDQTRIRFRCDAGGNNDDVYIDEVTISGEVPPLADPTGLTVSADSSGGVLLDWDDNGEENLGGYNVYRSTTPGGPYAQIDSTGVGTSLYTDGAAAYDTIYYYVVTAVDTSDSESGNSNEEAIILYEGDLTFNGTVDTDDIAELGIGWLNPYDMTTFQKVARDWLKIPYSSPPLVSLGYWPLDETAGSAAPDASPNGYDGLLMNMDDSDWVAGASGNALNFDGIDDYVEITHDAALNPNTDSWSTSFWLQSDTASQGTQIISKRADTSPYTQYAVGLSSGDSYGWTTGGKLTFLFRETSGIEKGGYTTSDIDISGWTHVCVVLDRTAETVYVYINGVLVPVTNGGCLSCILISPLLPCRS